MTRGTLPLFDMVPRITFMVVVSVLAYLIFSIVIASDSLAPSLSTNQFGKIAVIGGVLYDVKATAAEYVEGSSVPGAVVGSVGGVGLNMVASAAHVLANIPGAARPLLYSVVGDDLFGSQMVDAISRTGVDASGVLICKTHSSAMFISLGDVHGELMNAVADTAILDDNLGEHIAGSRHELGSMKALLLEMNLMPEVALDAIRHAPDAFIALEPVSVPKAGRIVTILEQGVSVDVISPNTIELDAILAGVDITDLSTNATVHTKADALLERFPTLASVLVTAGADGVYLVTREGMQHRPARDVVQRVDSTGCGDAMVGAIVAAVAQGLCDWTAGDVGGCLDEGLDAAALVLQSTESAVGKYH